MIFTLQESSRTKQMMIEGTILHFGLFQATCACVEYFDWQSVFVLYILIVPLYCSILMPPCLHPMIKSSFPFVLRPTSSICIPEHPFYAMYYISQPICHAFTIAFLSTPLSISLVFSLVFL